MPRRIVVARTFTREVRFECPDDEVAAVLNFISGRPVMPEATDAPLDLSINALGGGYYDYDAPLRSEPGTSFHMLDRARRVLGDLVAREIGRNPVIRAGSVLVGGYRLLLVSDHVPGRRKLVAACLGRGFPVESADLLVVRQNEVVATPGRIHIPEESAELLPELRAEILESPFTRDWDGDRIHAVAPRAWTITPGLASLLIFLEFDSGALTAARPVAADRAAEMLLGCAVLPATGKGPALAMLLGLARGTPAWSLRVGTHARALWHIERLGELCAAA